MEDMRSGKFDAFDVLGIVLPIVGALLTPIVPPAGAAIMAAGGTLNVIKATKK